MSSPASVPGPNSTTPDFAVALTFFRHFGVCTKEVRETLTCFVVEKMVRNGTFVPRLSHRFPPLLPFQPLENGAWQDARTRVRFAGPSNM
jgi:hypothetical protein